MINRVFSFTAGLVLFTTLLAGCSDPASPLALGTLERDRLTLVATAAEFILSQPVTEGAHVAAGELIVQLDPTVLQSGIDSIEALIAAENANLLKLRNGPRAEEIAASRAHTETVQAMLTQSEQDLVRTRDLVTRRLAAQADLDTAQSRNASYAAQLREAQARLQLLLSGTRAEDLSQSEARIRNLQAQLSGAQRQLDDLSIRAPRSAIRDSLPWETGERVSPGAIVAVLLSDGLPYARIYLPEPWRQRIAIGSTMQVHVDGSEQPFAATVRWIALDPSFTPYYALNSTERSRLVYMTELQLPEAARALPAGLPVQVELPQ